MKRNKNKLERIMLLIMCQFLIVVVYLGYALVAIKISMILFWISAIMGAVVLGLLVIVTISVMRE